MTTKLGIFGAGGHAKVVADTVVRQNQYTLHGYYDDHAERHGDDFYLNLPIHGNFQTLLDDLTRGTLHAAFVAIGNNAVRTQLGDQILAAGHTLATLIDPTAILSPSVQLGVGSLVVAGAILNADTRIAQHVIVNTGASIDHDCIIARGVHIAPHATLCGGVRVGAHSLVGAGATMIPGTALPEESVLGAGSTLTTQANTLGVYVGSPAERRPTKNH